METKNSIINHSQDERFGHSISLKALVFLSTLNTGCILALFWFFVFWN